MSGRFLQDWELSLHPISPIHIGSGVTIEPYEYEIVKSSNDGLPLLRMIDIDRRLASLSNLQREEFLKVERRGDFAGLRDWLRKASAGREFTRYTVPIEPMAAPLLQKMHANANSTGEIHLMTRHAVTGIPYVPGSSIKGSIRTAMVAWFAPKNPPLYVDQRTRSPDLEAAILGHVRSNSDRPDLYKDPFRQIAIGDIPLDEYGCKIDRIEIVRRRAGAARSEASILMFRDVTYCSLDGEVDLAFKGQARFYPELAGPAELGSRRFGSDMIDPELICKACNAFYRPRLEREVATFVSDKEFATVLTEAKQINDPLSCLIRLGRHSHFECVTIGEPYAQPPRRGAGATRSYAGGIAPLGWALLTWRRR